MLGRAYEYLIEKFADDAGKKGGEFYTPNMVVKLIVELLEPKEGMRICDPTVGSGGMLIQSAKYITEHGGQAKNFSLFGQEKNLGTWAICKMNMLLHGFPDARIEKGDTIRDPKLLQDGELMLFDRVIANPPFSLDAWGREVAESDSHGRFRFGIPPKTKGDLAFFQHMVATLNMQGKMGIVMPHGVLFRGSAEGKIRQGLIEEDLIETVVGLPTNLFYGTGIPAAILIVNRDKPKARKGKVLFVEASREFREASNQNFLRERTCRRSRRRSMPSRTWSDTRGSCRRGDREERLQPQHQPLRGHRRGRGEGGRGLGRGEAARGREARETRRRRRWTGSWRSWAMTPEGWSLKPLGVALAYDLIRRSSAATRNERELGQGPSRCWDDGKTSVGRPASEISETGPRHRDTSKTTEGRLLFSSATRCLDGSGDAMALQQRA